MIFSDPSECEQSYSGSRSMNEFDHRVPPKTQLGMLQIEGKCMHSKGWLSQMPLKICVLNIEDSWYSDKRLRTLYFTVTVGSPRDE